MAVASVVKTKRFRAFRAFCLEHGRFRVSLLSDVKTEPGAGETGGSYMRAYVICPKCPDGDEASKVNVPEKLRLDLVEMVKANR